MPHEWKNEKVWFPRVHPKGDFDSAPFGLEQARPRTAHTVSNAILLLPPTFRDHFADKRGRFLAKSSFLLLAVFPILYAKMNLATLSGTEDHFKWLKEKCRDQC